MQHTYTCTQIYPALPVQTTSMQVQQGLYHFPPCIGLHSAKWFVVHQPYPMHFMQATCSLTHPSPLKVCHNLLQSIAISHLLCADSDIMMKYGGLGAHLPSVFVFHHTALSLRTISNQCTNFFFRFSLLPMVWQTRVCQAFLIGAPINLPFFFELMVWQIRVCQAFLISAPFFSFQPMFWQIRVCQAFLISAPFFSFQPMFWQIRVCQESISNRCTIFSFQPMFWWIRVCQAFLIGAPFLHPPVAPNNFTNSNILHHLHQQLSYNASYKTPFIAKNKLGKSVLLQQKFMFHSKSKKFRFPHISF